MQFADDINRKVIERAEIVRELKKTIVRNFNNNHKPEKTILKCCPEEPLNLRNDPRFALPVILLIGPIPWGHSGPLCHALSLSLASWTSMRRRRATVQWRHLVNWREAARCGEYGPNNFQMLLVDDSI